MSTEQEKEFVEALKSLADFECWPIPQSWYKKYNIPPRGVVDPKEFIESQYTMKMSIAKKELSPLIIDKPQQDGKITKLLEPEKIDIKVISRPFKLEEGEMFPAVLPFLKDHESVRQESLKDVLDTDQQVQLPLLELKGE